MKNRRRVADIVKKALVAFLAATIAFSTIAPAEVEAAAKKKTLKATDFVNYASEADRYASNISKKGTYNIKVKYNNNGYFQGYLRFKAPKSGKYKFEFSNVKEAKKKKCFGSVYGTTPGEYDYMYDVKFSTTGRSGPELYLGSNKSSPYLKTRTGTINLKKNQKLYLFFSFRRLPSSKAKYMNIKLKIK